MLKLKHETAGKLLMKLNNYYNNRDPQKDPSSFYT